MTLDQTYKCILSVFCVLFIGKEVVIPVVVALATYQSFMGLVVRCDSAMNSSWFIQQTGDEALLKSEKIQMMDCHDYDKTRKIMLISGLPENYLSFLGLRALELDQRSADELAEPHRFKVR